MRTAVVNSNVIRVLVADSNQMQNQLLTSALRRRPEFRVSSCELTHNAVLTSVAGDSIDVALLNAEKDVSVVRSLHLGHPRVRKVLLVKEHDRNTVANAFRAGARGLFCFSESPFRLLCRCIHCVHEGQLWVSNQQLEFLIESVAQVPSLRVVNHNGSHLLTAREEQVVALVADGLTNRDVARELGLTENTVKKYLFHIFDKVGVSSRVELVLFAVTHGAVQNAEWIPAPTRQ